MSSPITLETQVGYIEAEDVYVSYSEYYGDGTIYGRNDLLMPDGSPVKGAGKTKAELINANVTLSEVGVGTGVGDIVVVPNDSVPAPAPEENNRYTVSFSVLGFEITREFTVKIDKETRKIYLS